MLCTILNIKEKQGDSERLYLTKPSSIEAREAEQMVAASCIDEGFCIFYDIKRWIGDYEKEEEILPTWFAEYEHYNRSDYYKVRNNFYILFHLTEQLKSRFMDR